MTSSRDPLDELLSEIGPELRRILGAPSPVDVTRQLHATMERAMHVADPEARPIIVGQLNVLSVVNRWISQLTSTDQPSTMRVDEAISQIMSAIETGLRGETL